MSFLDNSGDIILDAVLTEVGRQRLARGDGSFKITKFSLGDDEINYALYNATTSSGYEDLQIMNSPVFEAVTNSSTTLRHRLITLSGMNGQLYLPVARVNTKEPTGEFPGFPYATSGKNDGTSNQFVVLANQLAVNKYIGSQATWDKTLQAGFINGVSSEKASKNLIVIDQGLDTNQGLTYTKDLPSNITEDVYFISMDDRLLGLTSQRGEQSQESFVDTDNVATYVVSAEFFFRPGATGDSEDFAN